MSKDSDSAPDPDEQEILDEVIKRVDKVFGGDAWRRTEDFELSLRCFGGKRLGYLFCWTTNRDSLGKFWTVKYRVLKSGQLKQGKSVRFSKRKTAKARAEQWYDSYVASKQK